jgi:hypothetical protein
MLGASAASHARVGELALMHFNRHPAASLRFRTEGGINLFMSAYKHGCSVDMDAGTARGSDYELAAVNHGGEGEPLR